MSLKKVKTFITALKKTTGFYVGLVLAWKKLNTYLYYLVFINILPFNREFVMFLLWIGLESNQILTDVFKNVKM